MNSEKIELITNSDKYWDKYWSKINKAKDFIFIVTYDIDNKMIANITLQKLIEASERGVKVILVVEHLNFYMKQTLLKTLKKAGGIVIKPNPGNHILMHLFQGNLKKFFNRSHQKVTLIDKDLFLGSINMADEYSNIKYGSFKFIDLNVYVKNTITYEKVLNFYREIVNDDAYQISNAKKSEIDQFIVEQIDKHRLINDNQDLDSQLDLELISNKYNDNIDKHLDQPNNPYPKRRTEKYNFNHFEEFLEEKPPKLSEIQDNIYDLLESAEESILIIQSYYVNMKRIEDILERAAKRGVKVKIITADKRDQDCYRYAINTDLFDRLLNIKNVEVKEYLDKLLHMKAYYVDKKMLSVGSMNNDITSFAMNNEANYFVIKNKKNLNFFKQFDSMVEELEDNSKPVIVNGYRSPFRLVYSYWWYFFLWTSGQTASNRKNKFEY